MHEQAPAKTGSTVSRKLALVGILLCYGLGRFLPGFAVNWLIRTLDCANEETSMAAYMALVKLGPRNAEQLLTAARKGRSTASIVQLLGDMGERRFITDLQEFSRSPDPQIATAARDSIELLQSPPPPLN